MPQTQLRSRRQNFILIVTLGILNALTPFTIDMYLPAFPAIARDLRVPIAEMALTVSIYFIGFALGQLFYGPLLDRFGRKPPIYFGLALYVLATLGCMQSRSLEALLFFRFVSALGGCAASVGATAMVRDFFPAEEAAKIFSFLMLVLSASPLLAPSVGSLVVSLAHWRVIFTILAGLGVLNAFLLAFALPPGHPPDRALSLRFGAVARSYLEVLRIPQFTLYAVAGALSFTGLFVYVASSPAIFLDGFHVTSSAYGGIFAFLAVGMIGGGQLNHLFTRHFSLKGIFRFALVLQMVFGLLFLLTELAALNHLLSTIAFLFLILVSAGVASPNAAALALAPLERNIGTASALLGSVQLGIGAFASALVGLFHVRGSLPTASVIFVSSLLALLCLALMGKKMHAATATV